MPPMDPGNPPPQRAVRPKASTAPSIWGRPPLTAAAFPKARVALSVWGPEPVRGTGDREIARIAERQRGCVHRAQLAHAGLTRHAVAHRRRTGRLHPVYADVFVVGRPRMQPLGLETAAVLHAEGYGVLSGLTAAVNLWEVSDLDVAGVTLTVVGRDLRSRPGLTVHRVSALHPADIRVHQGLPVTAPARTILDCAGELAHGELEGVIATFMRRALVSAVEIEAAIARAPYAKGIGTTRALLGGSDRPARTRSVYERRLLRLIREALLPPPQVNVRVGDLEVDFLWAQQRLIVEFDGFGYHGDRRAFERDRIRDQRLALLGYQVVRVTARQLDQTPFAVIAAIASMLGARAA